MSRPIDIVLGRLEGYKLRETSRDRWRACCPAHGGRNPSALSVGVGDDEAVLLRCWQGCDVEQIAHALGLELTDLFPPKAAPADGTGPLKRRRLLPAHQALALLTDEANLVAVAAAALAHGHVLSDADLDRLMTASARVSTLMEEARS